MKNIEFIEWMCEKAEGFKYIPETPFLGKIELPDGSIRRYGYGLKPISLGIIYPLLLRRAIEGVNRIEDRNNDGYPIIQTDRDIIMYMGYSTDQAKEEALKYFFEQEAVK